ncbi:unnamed protein product [Adineta ricciae]|uniref:ARID domain-containing protein n=1 Tax=Adineta ricciae TaxID=249248 RepID=A0A813MQG1_ADIRI|nr:unnamed protein product [Adineta ricciae]
MYGVRDRRSSSTLSQSIYTDESNTNTSTLSESACLPIGCSVSAKYRGAFCSAQVKTVVKQVQLKVTLLTTGETITISDEQIVQPALLRMGRIVTIRLPLSIRHEATPHLSRSGLAAIINASNNYEEKQATIKRIYDNSTYTVVFNDGDEKSLRRSSLCLQGIRLYQNQIDQQKLLEDIPTPAIFTNSNDMTSIVAVQRSGTSNQQVFPALKLKRKSLADYMWIKSFLDGREYIVHKRDDVYPYKNNSEIQSLCRSTSKQATKACEKFIKYNQIPVIWQKKKSVINDSTEEKHLSDNESSTSDTDVDDSDEETTEEKDSFVAQLFAFMEDRGTPMNNIPKVHGYNLDLHRLFKIVRRYGGYNKVVKNDQWGKVYIKMGLPDESSVKNSRLVENAYKKHLYAYEELSKKLGTMTAPNAYFGGRTSLSSDSRRSLIRVRQLSDEKTKSKYNSTSNKRQFSKRQSIDSKPTLTPGKPRRKNLPIGKTRSSNVVSSSTSDSETSDDETTNSSTVSSNNRIKKQANNSPVKKFTPSSEEKKQPKNQTQKVTTGKKPKSTNDADNDMTPVIKIAKISEELLKESTLVTHKNHRERTSKQTETHDLTPLPVTPVSPSPPPSAADGSPSVSTSNQQIKTLSDDVPVLEVSTTLPTLIPSWLTKRTYSDDNFEFTYKTEEQLSPSKRSRSSLDSIDTSSSSKHFTYDDLLVNDKLMIKRDTNRQKQYCVRCLEKNDHTKELRIQYIDVDSKHDEWIAFDQVVKRRSHSTEGEISVDPTVSFISIEEEKARREGTNKTMTSNPDDGIWKSLEIISLNENESVPNFTTNDNKFSSSERTTSSTTSENPIFISINDTLESIDDNPRQQAIPDTQLSNLRIVSAESVQIDDNTSTPDIFIHPVYVKEEIIDNSSSNQPATSSPREPYLPNNIQPYSPMDNRRASTRQPKRRIYRQSSISAKKRTRLETDLNSNSSIDNLPNNNEQILMINDQQQQTIELKRYRLNGKRGGKRTINPTDNENEDYHTNSSVNLTLREQLEDMFKSRPSRYNFLDLNNDITGDERLAHLKDRMRQCQKVFLNLKSALTRVEKQKRLFIRRQKLTTAQSTTNELLLSSSCK